jgi:hypothetical protein
LEELAVLSKGTKDNPRSAIYPEPVNENEN